MIEEGWQVRGWGYGGRDEFQRWVWRERNDLNGGDKEEMISLEVELGRGHNGMKDEIEEVMLEGM